ncbi:putative Small heat-shock protein, partial [Quillaja saponaria]
LLLFLLLIHLHTPSKFYSLELKEMESEVIRHRINTIVAHFASNDDIPATHIIPLNYTSSLNFVISRRDNKIALVTSLDFSESLCFTMGMWGVRVNGYYNSSHHRPIRIAFLPIRPRC